jgi:hypothetical protein
MRKDCAKDRAVLAAYPKVHGEDVAPGESFFSSTEDPVILNQEDFKQVTDDSDPKMSLLLFIVITYKDTFGNSYETDSCRFYNGSHPVLWHHCGFHEAIK